MKFVLLLVFLCLFPLALYARDLVGAARAESVRRSGSPAAGSKAVPVFTNADLERYRRFRSAPSEGRPRQEPARAPSADRMARDRARRHWRKEKEQHERELSRVDARIRRLEWRLRELEARRRPGERLTRDPTLELVEESLQSLREERERLHREFLDRARKAGALPGWLR